MLELQFKPCCFDCNNIYVEDELYTIPYLGGTERRAVVYCAHKETCKKFIEDNAKGKIEVNSAD